MSAAVSTSSRNRVLHLYKQILKLAKNWKAKDAERTLTERKDIVKEAKQSFRENKKVTDPKQIAELVLEAEKRLVQAEHYGIPYARPDYVEPQTAYSWCFLDFYRMTSVFVIVVYVFTCISINQRCLQTSTSLAKHSRKSQKNEIDLRSGISVTDFDHTSQTFIRRYFAGSKIPEEVIDDVVKSCSTNENFYEIFVNSVLCNELLEKYPIRKSYRRNLLKRLIEKMEHLSVEVSDEIYDICASSMVDTADHSYRIFLSDDFNEILVVLRESNQQLCYGTTGLSLWQASCDLANLLCRFIDLSTKNVLELGAGCGLAGIAVARTFPHSSLILSDYDPKVLNQLEYNVELNVKDCSNAKVSNLDWTSFSLDLLLELPDVVIAADVVYDCSILPALCDVLRMCIYAKQECCAYIASTLRDPLTLQAFKSSLDANDLRIREELRYQYGKYTFLNGSKCRCSSLFPHSSTLDAPTIIYEVVRKI